MGVKVGTGLTAQLPASVLLDLLLGPVVLPVLFEVHAVLAVDVADVAHLQYSRPSFYYSHEHSDGFCWAAHCNIL
jgi:hypothetical protein